jgi:hypothetical protein
MRLLAMSFPGTEAYLGGVWTGALDCALEGSFLL